MNRPIVCAVAAVPLLVLAAVAIRAADTSSAATPLGGAGPPPDERQLPFAMHSQMEELPSISVGRADAAIIGADNRALQAAVDYIAALGGGTVTIGPGEYIMHDSLHLRSNVTVRGTPGKTILKKAEGAVSPLALDGDFGEQQITVAAPDGLAVGRGVAIWDKNSGGFHTTVARITGRRGNTFAIDKPLMADCMVAAGAFDAYYEDGVHVWDWAAGALIAAEAGAVLRLPPVDGGAGMVVAAAPGIADALAEELRRSGAL